MFIDGIAGIENTAFTLPSVKGVPSDCFTVTTKLLSPLLGGFGSLASVIVNPPVACDAAGAVLDAGASAGRVHATLLNSAIMITVRLKPHTTSVLVRLKPDTTSVMTLLERPSLGSASR